MRTVARIKSILLVVLLAMMPSLVLTGCSEQGKPRYALCLSHLTNHFTNTLASAARARASERDVELIVMDAQQNAARQAGQIETLLQDGIDGLMIEPVVATGLESVLRQAMTSGMPVVLVTQRVNDPELYDCYVGTDARANGQLEMTACLEAIGHRGDLAVLLGPVGSQATDARYLGYQAALADQPNVRIVAELNADWSADRAETIVSSWLLAGKQMDAIVAQNDEMAIGAINALRTTGQTGSIQVFGIDASDKALQAIRQGEMTATISQQTALQGSKALDICIGLSRKESFPAEILVPQVVITKENIDMNWN
jgi:ribose transport system substrate-binding protein/inositol transport system substrate-binding protein